MIISFSVSNYLSFKDKVTFSMECTRETQKKERLPYIDKYKCSILPIASIYGGNASGKTNFVSALKTAQSIVVRGTQIEEMIPVQTFLLDRACAGRPSCFTFVLCIKDKFFEYGFEVTRKGVEAEWLIEILKTTENELFRRKKDKITSWHTKFKKNKRLEVVFEGTRNNQLFLTNSVDQNVAEFKEIYNWFRNTLVIIEPHTKFRAYNELIAEEAPLYSLIHQALLGLDTGITKLGEELIAFDSLPIPPEMSKHLERMPPGSVTNVEVGRERFVVHHSSKGELKAGKIISFHRDNNGDEIPFDYRQESDGTQRVVDLLPAFIEASQKQLTKVYIIDELDRSLHSVLTRKLIQSYLNGCSVDSRSQLIFTTHDLMLMNQNLLRRDEMSVMERDEKESSQLYTISDYKDVRSDTDIRKSYMQGRFGGIPNILMSDSFSLETLWSNK